MKRLLAINWRTLVPAMKANIFKLSWFTIVFGFIKLNAFTAALLLSNFVAEVSDYGLFEYALSVGFMIAIPLDFGLNGAYPYFNLKLKKEGFQSIFYFHGLLIGSFILGLLGLQQLIPIIPQKYLFAAIIGGIVAMQALSSAILKSHEILFKAVLFDGGLFLTLNAYNAWLYFTGNPFEVIALQIIFSVYLILLTVWYGYTFYQHKIDFVFKNYLKALQFGKNIVFSAFLIITLTGSARIFIEWFLDLAAVGYYGFYFRFAAMTVMLHQIVNIVFFKKMYQADAKKLDTYFALFLQILILGGLFLWQVIPPLFKDYLSILQDSYDLYEPLYFILTFQMIYWIALALNENILYREGLSSRMNIGFTGIILLMVVSLWCLNQYQLLTLFWVTIINMVAIFLATEYQFYLLQKKDIAFHKMRWTGRVIFLIFCLGYSTL